MSTSPKVWQFICLLFAGLSIAVALFFFFIKISIVFVIGGALIMLFERLSMSYRRKMAVYSLSPLKRKFLGFGVVLFWSFAFFFLVGSSITQLGIVVGSSSAAGDIGREYVQKLWQFMPGMFSVWLEGQDIIGRVQGYMFSFLKDVFSGFYSIILNAVLIIPLMFLMYYGRGKTVLRKGIGLMPSRYRHGFISASIQIKRQLYDFASAKVVESIVVGAICCLGFYFAGLKGWLFLGVLSGFLNIMPYIGPLISLIPPVFIGLLQEPQVALISAATIGVAQLVDNLYLVPFMISSKVKIDSLLGVVLILIGATLFGPVGMIFALPIYLVYKIILKETYIELERIYGK